jgi:multimeric flavodoxin WrbA
MKAIVLHGSPRKNSNSDTLAEYFVKGFKESGTSETQDFYINELNIRPCQGCLSCKTSVNHACAMEDDMTAISSGFIDADIIVFTTPMYWGYLTAQLKTVLDRMESLTWEQFYNKTFVALITYHHHFESALAFFERICPHFNIDLHAITCCTLDKNTGRDVPVIHFPEKLAEATELGKSLGQRAKS